MDAGQDVLQDHNEPSTSARSGFVCHKPEPPITNICVPDPGPRSSGSGRISGGLEQVEDALSLSSYSNDFEGFTETDRVSRDCLSSSAELAVQPLVPDAASDDPDIHSSEISSAVPTGEGQDMLGFLLAEPRPSRVDFLRRCYNRKYPSAVTDLIVQKLCSSTMNQYESTRKLFLNFLHAK